MANDFKTILKDFKSDILNRMDSNHEQLTKKCELIDTNISEFRQYVGNEISKLKTKTNDNENKITILETTTDHLKADILNLSKKLSSLSTEKDRLEQTLDDQINRNLRKTLIFLGIKEEENEKCSKTASKLATFLSNIDNKVNYDDVMTDIDRAHRPAGNRNDRNNNNNKDRPIFVQFTSWKSAEYYFDSLVQHNRSLKRNNTSTEVYVDHMYSPKVTARRKIASNLRKEIQERGDNAKMYVKYPAILMKYDTQAKKYLPFQEF
uniref:Uncharacterized protein n=1 Tax=Clytia hemisphaerica TaxID=252671 RepID=A0A7M6DNF6_9CNID